MLIIHCCVLDGDMSERCNILVSEVFDSELIGEGAIETFSHAKRELLVVRGGEGGREGREECFKYIFLIGIG